MPIITGPARLMLSAGLAALVARADPMAVGIGVDRFGTQRTAAPAVQDPAPAVAPVAGFASVRGVAADRFGGPLSGVDVLLTNDQSGERRTAKTAADATFEFLNLPGGTYSLEASRDGFARAFRDVTLKDDETSIQTMTLQVGNLEETLRVVSGRELAPGSDGSGRRPPVRPSESPRDRVCGADGTGCVIPARKVADLRPQYPPSASQRGMEGIVIAEAVIDEQGSVGDVRVLRSVDDQLDAAVVDALRQWQFVPTMLNGAPTPSLITVTVEFAIAVR
jgi:TonB family protein